MAKILLFVAVYFIATLASFSNDEFNKMADSLKYYYEADELDRAEQWKDSLIIILESINVANYPIYHDVLNMIANFYYQKKDKTNHIKYYYKVKNAKEEYYGSNSLEFGHLLAQLGSREMTLQKFDSAKVHLHQSVSVIENLDSIPFEILGKAYKNLGYYYDITGDINKGEEYYLKALEIFKTKYKKDDLHFCITYDNLAFVSYIKSNFIDAINYTKLSMKMQKRLKLDSNITFFKSFYQLALYEIEIGNYLNSLKSFNEALKYLEKQSANPRDIFTVKSSIASLYFTLGDYINAEKIFVNIIKEIERNYSGYDFAPFHYNNYANFLKRLGRYKSAENYYIKSKNTIENLFNGDHIDKVNNLVDYGALRFAMGDTAAVEYLIDAKNMLLRLIKKPNYQLYQIQLKISEYYYLFSNYDNVKSNIDTAFVYIKQINPNENSRYAFLYSNYAKYYEEIGAFEKAEVYYEKSIKLYGNVYSELHPFLIRNKFAKFHLRAKRNKLNNSKDIFLPLFYKMNNKISYYFKYFTEDESDVYFRSNVDVFYKQYLNFLIENNITDQDLLKLAFENQIFTKGKLLNIAKDNQNIFRNIQDPYIQELFNQNLQLSSYIAKLSNYSLKELQKRKINLDSLIFISNELEQKLKKLKSNYFHSDKIYNTFADIEPFLNTNDYMIDIFKIKKNDKSNYYAIIYNHKEKIFSITNLPVLQDDIDLFYNELNFSKTIYNNYSVHR